MGIQATEPPHNAAKIDFLLLLLCHGASGLVKAYDKNSGLVFESQVVPDVFKFYLFLSGFIAIACLLTPNVCMVVFSNTMPAGSDPPA